MIIDNWELLARKAFELSREDDPRGVYLRVLRFNPKSSDRALREVGRFTEIILTIKGGRLCNVLAMSQRFLTSVA